jgi:hypothetical protein
MEMPPGFDLAAFFIGGLVFCLLLVMFCFLRSDLGCRGRPGSRSLSLLRQRK